MKQYLYSLATDQRNALGACFLKACLRILSWIYLLGVQVVLWCYHVRILKTYCLPKPVISVGNITMGGVGKTPLVIYLAKLLQEKGFKPVILTRGYMIKKQGVSDEAEMLKQMLSDVPILVGQDRIVNARQFLKDYQVDVFLLDDGFQHWKLFRDMDIVVIDAANPFGNNSLIPRGILREPLSSLKRAGSIILTKIDSHKSQVEKIKDYLIKENSDVPIIETVHKPVEWIDLDSGKRKKLSLIKNQRVIAFSSIGQPKAFENTLKQLGVKAHKHFCFVDHYSYMKQDIEGMLQYAQEQKIDTFVTTSKDAVKLEAFLKLFKGLNILELKIELKVIKGGDEGFERIFSILQC